MPRPTALNHHLERDTQECSNEDDAGEDRKIGNGRLDRYRVDDVWRGDDLAAKQN